MGNFRVRLNCTFDSSFLFDYRGLFAEAFCKNSNSGREIKGDVKIRGQRDNGCGF